MAIKNPSHVKGVREGVHAGIQAFAMQAGLGPQDLDGIDCLAGLMMVVRDIIQSAPDGFTRAQLAAQAEHVIKDAGRGSVIIPAREMPVAGHA